MFASIWGYHIGVAFLRKEPLLVTAAAAIGVTAFLHGSYDFVVLALPGPALPIAALLILVIWLWRMRLIRDLQTASFEQEKIV
jgi:RsiW-degrading membrane proteinase PrsW (M82 family)